MISIDVKLRKIGNSIGVILPKEVITCYNIGDVITINVITKNTNVITPITKPVRLEKKELTLDDVLIESIKNDGTTD